MVSASSVHPPVGATPGRPGGAAPEVLRAHRPALRFSLSHMHSASSDTQTHTFSYNELFHKPFLSSVSAGVKYPWECDVTTTHLGVSWEVTSCGEHRC